MSLPEYETCPSHLDSRTRLKKEGLVPTGASVATLRFRTPKGYRSCELFERKHTRPITEAKAALKRRQANLGGQYLLLEAEKP